MTRTSLVRLASLLSLFASLASGRAEAQLLSENDPNFGTKLKALIEAIKPLPETPIPDDPPPHEGAMIDIPYVIEPPDLLIVEVLEALPGKPITGERLVRPDGTISLGFYGTIHVRGLTLEQAKVKIVQHLRSSLPDAVLGLEEVEDFDPAPEPKAMPGDGPKPPEGPKGVEGNGPKAPAAPEGTGKRPASLRTPRQGSGEPEAGRRGAIPPVTRRVRRVSDGPGPDRPNALTGPDVPNPMTRLTLPGGGRVSIFIDVQPAGPAAENRAAAMPLVAFPPPPDLSQRPGYHKRAGRDENPARAPFKELTSRPAEPDEAPFKIRHVAPADSNRVFVDISAYNSKYYYVTGDVASPGRMPTTGTETVLDALNYGGGLIQTAEPADIRLVRPARGGKPRKVYPVNLPAITEGGDTRQNYQIFPGDRLIVGRNKLVQNTMELDRLAASFQTLVNSTLQITFTIRSLVAATPDLSAAQREALLDEWFKVWWQAANQPGGPTPDEKTYRELFLRLMKPAPAPATPPEKK